MINLIVLALIIYHQLSAGHFDVWLLAVYLAFVGFLGTRGRRLKSRVAPTIALTAHWQTSAARPV